ncbi:SDR family NAD(P)-dependent oxidoreductase [Streptomyces sp. ODS28]|uniref:SDR family NAD(P)-dependent oxidoreductase n=1 Tax=Streptomyces sp. ODS28 TaxID=3136688 RepID=UPI0031EF0EBB
MPRPFQPVAIVAATCVLPGARTLDDLWGLFEREETAIGRLPEDWPDRDLYGAPDGVPGSGFGDKAGNGSPGGSAKGSPNTSRTDTAARVDPWEFSRPPRLPPKQAAQLDPTHRMALETGQRIVEQLEDVWLPRDRTGVWVANTCGAPETQFQMLRSLTNERWAHRAAAHSPQLADTIAEFRDAYRRRHPHPREDGAANGNIVCGRIANYFDLRGPQMSLDAACAGSMAALRYACLSLEDGSADMAFVASIGTQTTAQLVLGSAARALSPGASFPFARDADGAVLGEGAVMLACVRAEDAERHGLRTLGVIRSIGSSVNGRGESPWSPSEAAERLAITRAWEEGEFSPEGPEGRIDYIEAHGAATPDGDRTEHAAMLATYGKAADQGPVPFGSVKSVVGHTVESAGLAGVLRALYVFGTGRVPPTVGVREPAPFLAADSHRLRLAVQGEPLPDDPSGADRLRRVAVSSFGVGGLNYHALLESGLAPGATVRRAPASREPVAVVGVSAVMPGAPDSAGVWEHLRTGTAVRDRLADHIPDFALFHHPDVSQRDRTVCPVGSVVDPGPLREPMRWRVPPKRAERLFPDHVLLLNAASQLVEQDVLPSSPAALRRSGVYITDTMDTDGSNRLLAGIHFARWWSELRAALEGTASLADLDALETGLRDDPGLGLRAVTEDDAMAGQGVQGAARVASGLELGGAAVAVNSACASGLAALSLAMQELRAGTLDFALVGGASLGVDEVNQVALSAIGALSAGGCGRPYDERADGFVVGSGAAWFALKRLSDARRDGDRVLAVVRECAGGSDGKGRSLLAPSREGRHEVISRTFRRAVLDPRTVQYVEGHGAANVLGDSSELEAVGTAMGTPSSPVMVGSIKGNYGHLKGPAALAGLLKVVLCLNHCTLVPTAGYARRGELPGVDDRLVRVLDRCVPWPENGSQPRRASVNAFGLGGTNFHAIVDEAPAPPPEEAEQDEPEQDSVPLRLAASSPEELARRLAESAPSRTEEGADAAEEQGSAWRAALFVRGGKAERAGRAGLAARIGARAADVPCEMTDLGAWSGPAARSGPVIALFPGQAGAQNFDSVAWLAGLAPYGPAALRELEDVLGAPGRTIGRALREGDIGGLGALRSRSGTSQVLGLLASYLVWRWFADRAGEQPVAALGHSAGEFAALVAAGSLSLADGLRVCWERGRYAEEAAAGRKGLMAAVFAGPERVRELLAPVPEAFLGTVNGSKFCVVSGWEEPVRGVLERCRDLGISSTPLDIGLPFHTPLLAEAAGRLRVLLDGLDLRPPRTPVYSALHEGPYLEDVTPDTVRTAVAALYTEPVRLDHLLTHARRAGARRFVECGAGRSLSRSVAAVLPAFPHLALAGVTSPEEGVGRLGAGLWVAGLNEGGPAAAVRDLALAEHNPAAESQHTPRFEAFTPVPVPVRPYEGGDWTGVSVLVVTARGGALGGEMVRALEAAGARVGSADVAELAGTGEAVGAAGIAERVRGAAGERWVVWASPPEAVPAGEGADAPRTMAELACMRTVVSGLAEGWERYGAGGLVVVTGTDGRFGHARSPLEPTGGALAGFARALSHEHPEAGIVLADAGRDLRPAAAADRLAALGRPPSGHHELGLSSTDFWAPELTPVPLSGGTDGLLDALREPDAAVLVSGGATGILAHILCTAAERLQGDGGTGATSSYPGRLVLLSRTAPADDPVPDLAAALDRLRGEKGRRLVAWRKENPGRSLHAFEREWRRTLHGVEARATLTRLRAAGLRAEHAAVDVCDGRAVRALGEQLRLDGVHIRTLVHGAGIERSSRITEKPAEEWEATAAVKVLGLHHLVAAAGDGLRTVIAHGSLSGSLGLPGQTDYSAANEYLAKAVVRLRAERPGVVAQYIGWPAWDRVGMAADRETKRRLEGMGLHYMPPERGAELALALAAGAAVLPPHITVLPVPVPPLAAARAARHRSGSDGVGSGGTAANRPGSHDPSPNGPAEGARWWLVDTVSWDDAGTSARVMRQYDTADPRDAELGDHRVRGNIRVAGVQIVEQFAEAYAATRPEGQGASAGLELRDVRLRQGLVTSTSGRRPVTVLVDHRPDGSAELRLETSPLLPGDFPGPGTVLLATATAAPLAEDSPTPGPVAAEGADTCTGGGPDFPNPPDNPDPIALAANLGITYGGRFTTEVSVTHHPAFDAGIRFTCPPPPSRHGRALTDPAALDIAIRTISGAAVRVPDAEQGLPSAFERVVLHPGCEQRAGDGAERRAFASARRQGGYDVVLTDRQGSPLVSIEGLRLTSPSDGATPPPTPRTTLQGAEQ